MLQIDVHGPSQAKCIQSVGAETALLLMTQQGDATRFNSALQILEHMGLILLCFSEPGGNLGI